MEDRAIADSGEATKQARKDGISVTDTKQQEQDRSQQLMTVAWHQRRRHRRKNRLEKRNLKKNILTKLTSQRTGTPLQLLRQHENENGAITTETIRTHQRDRKNAI